MGDRIAVFNKGIVEQLGAPMALYNRPANEFVAGFIGAPRINLIAAPAAAAPPQRTGRCGTRWPARRRPARSASGLRPEHLHLAPAGEGIAAKVVLAEHLGDSSIIHLRVDGVDDAAQRQGRRRAQPGRQPARPSAWCPTPRGRWPSTPMAG